MKQAHTAPILEALVVEKHGWIHAMCEVCWERMNPRGVPVRVKIVMPEVCCFCGNAALGGIYMRASLEEVLCCPDWKRSENALQ